jgi:hypothetical protein
MTWLDRWFEELTVVIVLGVVTLGFFTLPEKPTKCETETTHEATGATG